jgi:hypothetical protein
LGSRFTALLGVVLGGEAELLDDELQPETAKARNNTWMTTTNRNRMIHSSTEERLIGESQKKNTKDLLHYPKKHHT